METKHINYTTTDGVCSRSIHIDLAGDKIVRVIIDGGCHGNSQGIMKLLEGMEVEDAITRLEGINCKNRGTSCPDQIARALRTAPVK
ncbi:MAG: TIGR03905 family TSCPD domain-containing protein [Tannerellaceae bacterium]|nr:TIGR03905 family TSCPD domain-containing protein [Tannerellaceae bacterium]